MVFYYAFDREMLNAMDFLGKDKKSQKSIESIIEKEIKLLAFLIPLDERIVISPSFRFESSVCRRILKRNRAFTDNGIIVEYRREIDIKDFWLKKNETYRNVMDISNAYRQAYDQKSIYKEISSLWIDRIPKQNAIGLISRDTFMEKIRNRGKIYDIPTERTEDVLKITDETKESTFLWEREEYMLHKYGVPDDIIRRLGVREAMNQSYVDVFANQNIKIAKSSLGMVDISRINSEYNMHNVLAILGRLGVEKTIISLSAENIIDIRKNLELQNMLDIIRDGLANKESNSDICKAVNGLGDMQLLIKKTILQSLGGKSMDNHDSVSRQNGNVSEDTLKILHLSDLHFTDDKTMKDHYFYLKLDLKNIFSISHMDYLIISGDVSDRPNENMYKVALDFVQNLIDEFRICREHIILVPGNHDCDRTISKEAYDKDERNIIDQAKYNDRYCKYSKYFYEPIKGKPYPLEPQRQFEDYIFSEDNLCILALNSSWKIDHIHKECSSICMEAIQNSEVVWCDVNNYAKLTVWHHPLSGWAAIQDITFMDTLVNAGFKACLHGHIHEAKNDLFTYDAGHNIRMIGAGTFGAVRKERGDGIPRQYNIIEFDKTLRLLKVHTRKREKDNGIWQADARWGDKNHSPKSFYMVKV